VHTPLTEETVGLIDAAALAALPRGAVVVNAARGGIVDETALAAALDEGHVFAAGLDVFVARAAGSRPPAARPRRRGRHRPPRREHREAQRRVASDIVERTVRALRGDVALGVVNAPALAPEVVAKLGRHLELGEALGKVVAQLANGRVHELVIEFAGDFPLAPDPIAVGVAKGFLAPVLSDPPTYVNALALAKQRDVRVSRVLAARSAWLRHARAGHGAQRRRRHVVAGTVLGDHPRIVEIEGFPIEIRPEGTMLICTNYDRPGAVGRVGTVLGDAGINISGMQLSRVGEDGLAMFALTLDQVPSDTVLDVLRGMGDVIHTPAGGAAVNAGPRRAPERAAPERGPYAPGTRRSPCRPRCWRRWPDRSSTTARTPSARASCGCARPGRALTVPGDDVMLLTGSGTTAFEAALTASGAPAGRVLALRGGKFGDRWAGDGPRVRLPRQRARRRLGARVRRRVRLASLERDGPDAVTLVHSETSTGVLHDVAALAAAVRSRAPDALVLVDAVTSLAAAELRPRAWGLDAVVSGSQKGVMLPPGLAFAWLSERAWERTKDPAQRVPRYTLDLHRERPRQRAGDSGTTPATSLVVAAEVALERLLGEGLERRLRSLERRNRALLAAGAALGALPFAERPSPAVAALTVPEGMEAPAVVRALADRGVRIAGGQDHLKPSLLRPSLLGHGDDYDAVVLAAALEDAWRDLGRAAAPGVAVTAAVAVLAG
jgi:aspartate aminotransferase-like enzyme